MNDNNNNSVQVNEDLNQAQQNKKAGKKIAIFLGVLAVIGGSYFSYDHFIGSKYEHTENAYVNANQNVLTSQISGTISEIAVSDTQNVKKGFKAIQVEEVDFKIALSKAKNDLAKSVRSVKSLQINQDQSIENVQLKNIDFNKAKEDFDRDQKAFAQQVISKEQYENSKYKFEQAKIALEASKTALKNSQIQALSNTIQDHPDVARAINSYKQAYIDHKRTSIFIPNDGIVAKKSVYIGQRISTNQPLLTVIDLGNEWVDANFKESQIAKLAIGQKVELRSDVNHKTYIGYIAGIGAGSGSALSLLPAQNATGNWIKVVQRVPVRINILEKYVKENGVLPIGTSMEVKVILEEKEEINTSIPQKIDLSYNEDELNQDIQNIISENIKTGSK